MVTSAYMIFHLIDVIFALSIVVFDVTTFVNSVSQEAVESCSRLEEAVVLALLAELCAE